MEISLFCVGKLKEPYLKEGISEFTKRLTPYCHIAILEVPDEKVPDNPSQKEIEKVKNLEGQKLLKAIGPKRFAVALDLGKKQMESPEFADYIQKMLEIHDSKIAFVIGGSYGLSDEVKARVNDSMSLGKMTLTHQMTRLILLEQIYRAFKINGNEVYHK